MIESEKTRRRLVKKLRKPIVCTTCEKIWGECIRMGRMPYDPSMWCYDEVETFRVAKAISLRTGEDLCD